jgi:hypothetical protein
MYCLRNDERTVAAYKRCLLVKRVGRYLTRVSSPRKHHHAHRDSLTDDTAEERMAGHSGRKRAGGTLRAASSRTSHARRRLMHPLERLLSPLAGPRGRKTREETAGPRRFARRAAAASEKCWGLTARGRCSARPRCRASGPGVRADVRAGGGRAPAGRRPRPAGQRLVRWRWRWFLWGARAGRRLRAVAALARRGRRLLVGVAVSSGSRRLLLRASGRRSLSRPTF